MRIAHLSAEVSPFAKSGGLGDVVGALPKAQAALGHEVSVWMPLYRQVWDTLGRLGHYPDKVVEPFTIHLGPVQFRVGVLRTKLPGSEVPLYLIGQNECFDRPQIYSFDYHGHDDGLTRYALFVRAAFHTMHHLWNAPQVIHAHDWHTALAPMALAWDQPKDWVFNRTASILTIHNLAYQGIYAPGLFSRLGLPPAVAPMLDWHGALNLMKGALVSADAITAVSPTFAREIMNASGGFGLDPVARARGGDVTGIVNGIDVDVWNPATDARIPYHYDAERIGVKRQNRRALLERVGMDPDEENLVLGIVGRLTHQKGYELLFPIVEALLSRGIRIIFLGSGEAPLEQQVHHFSNSHVGRFWGYVGFREDLVHLIEAGSDAFVMPSLFEPCGLNQLYSLRYGTPPIVRRTGGLADTVEGYNGRNRATATGFSFDAATPKALYDTIVWAQRCYRDMELWTQIAVNGMRRDFSWQASAKKYTALYQSVLDRRGIA
jgi:starch synthase